MKSWVLLLSLGLSWSGQAAGQELYGTEVLRPLAVDLRRLYPNRENRWRRMDGGDYLRLGPGFQPTTIFLGASALPEPGLSQGATLLPRSADGAVTIRRGGVTLEQRLVGARPSLAQTEKGLLRYPGAYPHAEALYISDGAALERLFLLSDSQAPTRFVSTVRVSGGTLALQGDGGLTALDPAGSAAIRMSAPRVVDAEGRERAGRWTLRGGKKGLYTVVLKFDPSGLAYPLLIE